MNFANLRKGFYPDTYHVARVDVAYDIKDDSVPDMLKIINYVRLNKFKSKFRKYLPAAGNAEQWVYFGSGQSDTRLRIYNKAMERKREDEGKWIRFEYQLRNKSADRFLCQLLSCENLGQSMKDFLNESVMFTTQPNIGVLNNHHQTRLRPARWWAKLVEGAQKVEKFEVPGIEYNIQGVNRYIENQVAPSLFTKVAVDGGDITALMELILRNKDRLNDKQKALISENDIDVESDSLLRRYNYEWQEIETVDLAKMERRKLYNALRKEFESCPD
jgi:phage replication initiation protein